MCVSVGKSYGGLRQNLMKFTQRSCPASVLICNFVFVYGVFVFEPMQVKHAQKEIQNQIVHFFLWLLIINLKQCRKVCAAGLLTLLGSRVCLSVLSNYVFCCCCCFVFCGGVVGWVCVLGGGEGAAVVKSAKICVIIHVCNLELDLNDTM